MSRELDRSFNNLKKHFTESGYVPDNAYYNNTNNRLKVHNFYPDSFVLVSRKGNPIFPMKDRTGGLSYSLVQNSLDNANEMKDKTNDPFYNDVISKINERMKMLKYKHLYNKINDYKVNDTIDYGNKDSRIIGEQWSSLTRKVVGGTVLATGAVSGIGLHIHKKHKEKEKEEEEAAE